ncbi:ATP-binding cassette domain-containing protein [Rhizobium beringeri]
MSALEIQNIRKTYGDVETLKGIDISLESGEFLVLLGSSGCGKSTLLNIIAGLAEATSGDVRDRRPLGAQRASEGPRYRHGLSILRALSQSDGAPEHRLRPGNAQGAGAGARQGPCATPQSSCRSKTSSTASRANFSGGQRQRVAIGRALVRKPGGIPLRRAALQP